MAERSSTGDDLAIENCSTSRLRRKTAGLPRGGGSWKEVAWPTGRCRGDTPLLPPMRGRYAPRTLCKVRAMNKKDYAFAEMAAQRALCPPHGGRPGGRGLTVGGAGSLPRNVARGWLPPLRANTQERAARAGEGVTMDGRPDQPQWGFAMVARGFQPRARGRMMHGPAAKSSRFAAWWRVLGGSGVGRARGSPRLRLKADRRRSALFGVGRPGARTVSVADRPPIL